MLVPIYSRPKKRPTFNTKALLYIAYLTQRNRLRPIPLNVSLSRQSTSSQIRPKSQVAVSVQESAEYKIRTDGNPQTSSTRIYPL